MTEEHSKQSRGFFRGLRIFIGLLLIIFGLIYEQVIYFRNVPFQIFLIVSGLVLIVSGLSFLIPNSWRLSRFRWFRRVYRERFSTPPEVIAYIAMMVVLATGSMLGHSNTLLLVFALMAGPFVLNGWVVYAMLQRVRVERRVPERVAAGETFSIDLSLHNQRRFLSCRLMRVQDTISNEHEELSGRVLFFRVAAKQQRTAAYRARLYQRGVYTLGPTVVSSRFPFGLGERGRYFETPDEILVHPQIGEISPGWWRRVVGDDRIADDQRSTFGVFDDDFKQIREYRPGDSIRSIHWRTSARMDELMVREFQENREHDAVIVIDLWSASKSVRSDSEESYRTELAASFAATVCHEFSRAVRDGNVAFFLSGSENVSIVGKAAPELWDRILDALARCQPSPAASPEWLANQVAAVRKEQLQPVFLTTRHSIDAVDSTETGSGRGLGVCHVVHATREGLADIFRLREDDMESQLSTVPTETAS